MKRLTKKDCVDNQAWVKENDKQEAIDKLCHLEDFEEEKLKGCSLIKILTARQVYRKGKGMVDVISVVLYEEGSYPYIEIGYYKNNGKYGIETLCFEHHYGIKFALTEEEFKEIKDGH